MLPGSKTGRARGGSQARDTPAKLKICLFSALPSFESRRLHLLVDSEYLAHVRVLMTTLALLFWDRAFPFFPVWFVQGHLTSQLPGSFLTALG